MSSVARFLEPRHVELRVATQAFADGGGLEAEHDPHKLVAMLARAGLLRACVPASRGLPTSP